VTDSRASQAPSIIETDYKKIGSFSATFPVASLCGERINYPCYRMPGFAPPPSRPTGRKLRRPHTARCRRSSSRLPGSRPSTGHDELPYWAQPWAKQEPTYEKDPLGRSVNPLHDAKGKEANSNSDAPNSRAKPQTHRLGRIHQDPKEFMRLRPNSAVTRQPIWDPATFESLEVRLCERRRSAHAKLKAANVAREHAFASNSNGSNRKVGWQNTSNELPTESTRSNNSDDSHSNNVSTSRSGSPSRLRRGKTFQQRLDNLGTVHLDLPGVSAQEQAAMACAATAVKRALIQTNGKAYQKTDPKVP
jgi:hypothetical protein